MMNGVWFDDIHSYNDLNLILSAVEIAPASPKTKFVDIPGADGSVDLTEALGEIRFSDRKCTFTFTCLPTDDFEVKKREVSNAINGKRMSIRLDKDPDYQWDGRCYIDKYKSDKNLNKITIGATVSPYKMKTTETQVEVSAGTSVSKTLVRNCRKPIVPTIITTADATVVFGENTYSLNAGTHKLLGISLAAGNNTITVTSTGTTTIKYQEGDL